MAGDHRDPTWIVSGKHSEPPGIFIVTRGELDSLSLQDGGEDWEHCAGSSAAVGVLIECESHSCGCFRRRSQYNNPFLGGFDGGCFWAGNHKRQSARCQLEFICTDIRDSPVCRGAGTPSLVSR